jgi:small subunit ribosomal protein S3
MGHKINPVGFRVGIGRGWNSRWYANKKDFSTFLLEDIAVRRYLDEQLKEALVARIDIERQKTDKGFKVTVICHVARPGVVIGQDGANVNRLTKYLSKLVKTGTLKLDVLEVKAPDLDARLVALSIAKELEQRASFRTAQKKGVRTSHIPASFAFCAPCASLRFRTCTAGRLFRKKLSSARVVV